MTLALGEADTELMVNDRSLAMPCLIVGDVRFLGDILLKLNTMRDYQITINTYHWETNIGDTVVPLCSVYTMGHEFTNHRDYISYIQARGDQDTHYQSRPNKPITQSLIDASPAHNHADSQVGKINESLQGAPAIVHFLACLESNINQVRGILYHDTVLHSHALTKVIVKIPGIPDLDHVITDSDTCQIKGTYIEPSLHQIQNNTTTVYVANVTNTNIHLASGAHIVDLTHYSLLVRVVDEASTDQIVHALFHTTNRNQLAVSPEHLKSH